MLLFYLRRAFMSLRGTPFLSGIMIVNMALGLAIWTVARMAVVSQTRDPIADLGAFPGGPDGVDGQ